MKHIIRIDADWLRIPLLCIVWPLHFIDYMLQTALRHPSHLPVAHRLPIKLFWAAWDGAFVPEN